MEITDEELEIEWKKLSDIPVNNDGITEKKYSVGKGKEWQTSWSKGTDRQDIWHWFDEHHSKGVITLMLNNK